METLIILWVAWKIAGLVVEDGMYAARGKTPPRHEVRLAEIKAGIAPRRYGWRGAYEDLRDDALRAVAATAGHAIAAKAAEKLRARGVQVPDPNAGPGVAVDGSQQRNERGSVKPPVPAVSSESVKTPPQAAVKPEPKRLPVSVIHADTKAKTPPTLENDDDPNGPRRMAGFVKAETDRWRLISEYRTAGRCTKNDLSRPTEAGEHQPLCGEPVWRGDSAPPGNRYCREHTDPDEVEDPPETEAADVIPINRNTKPENTNQQEENTMTAPTDTSNGATNIHGGGPTSEITGLVSAVNYAKAVADAHATHAGGEQYIASLRRFEVGNDDIAKVAAAQEASSIAAAKWQAAAAAIADSNTGVKQAYQGSPNAGNKTFALGE